jgi:septal ring factor EnvC (AmiA/AmiB activator)
MALLVLAAASASADRASDLERLRAAIGDSRERAERYERDERGLLEAIEAIERTAELLVEDVEYARQRADEARAALARAEADAEALAERLARTERAMAKRAVALYRTGELGAVSVLFSAGELRDFLSRVQVLRRLLTHDAALLARHRAESRALAETRERAERAATERSAAREALRERSGQLREERDRKRQLVARLRGSRARERAALAELETAARALEEMVASLPAEADATAALEGPPFVTLRGKLDPPVRGAIARGFGRVVEEQFRTETFRKGVDFEVPMGTPVRAVAAGRVRLAGRFRGYGNLIILDHGDEFFTVSAHLSRIGVSVGDAVRRGQAVGQAGDTGSLSGPRLYFEIRRGEAPLDPRKWLRARAR